MPPLPGLAPVLSRVRAHIREAYLANNLLGHAKQDLDFADACHRKRVGMKRKRIFGHDMLTETPLQVKKSKLSVEIEKLYIESMQANVNFDDELIHVFNKGKDNEIELPEISIEGEKVEDIKTLYHEMTELEIEHELNRQRNEIYQLWRKASNYLGRRRNILEKDLTSLENQLNVLRLFWPVLPTAAYDIMTVINELNDFINFF